MHRMMQSHASSVLLRSGDKPRGRVTDFRPRCLPARTGREEEKKQKLGPICRRHYCASHPRRKRHKAFYDAREALGRTVRTHPELLLLFLQPIHPLPFCSSTNLGYLSLDTHEPRQPGLPGRRQQWRRRMLGFHRGGGGQTPR